MFIKSSGKIPFVLVDLKSHEKLSAPLYETVNFFWQKKPTLNHIKNVSTSITLSKKVFQINLYNLPSSLVANSIIRSNSNNELFLYVFFRFFFKKNLLKLWFLLRSSHRFDLLLFSKFLNSPLFITNQLKKPLLINFYYL